ncbi:hypothetical protein [Deinococcus hopiensis]|uniref:hypothetical protein n=1 Tax=Deinococcus hopiensis TaxID=309885 RepID=UPI0009FC6A8B|nr:hypothetical protein [Deinococcus hopiensis]
MPRFTLGLAAPFRETLRELPRWPTLVELDNSRLKALGTGPHTPWEEAVQTALKGLGACRWRRAAVRDRRGHHL